MKIEIIDGITVRVTNYKGDTFTLQDNEGFYTDFFKQENNQPLTLYVVSGCLICIMDNVEGNGLTKGMRYKILAEKDGMYCIIDDNNNLSVYGEIFFDKE